MKKWTIRKLLNDVLGCSKAIDIDAPITFSIIENFKKHQPNLYKNCFSQGVP